MSEMKISRLPFPIVTVEKSAFKETYGGAEDFVVSFCQLIRAADEAHTCLVTMHPIGGTGWLPIMNEFVHQGVHVLACDGRYRGVDNALNMEKACVDLGNAVRHAKEKLGYAHVVLLGGVAAARFQHFINRKPKTRPLRAVRVGPDRI